MKKFCLLMILCLLEMNAFCQTSQLRMGYLQKAKKQRNVAWILISAGTVIAASEHFITRSGDRDVNFSDAPKFDTGTWMFITGATLYVASVPLFVSSSVNSNRAARIGLASERLQVNNITLKSYPAITLRIQFN